MIKVIDNALPVGNLALIHRTVYDKTFLWQYGDKTRTEDLHDQQFARVIYQAEKAYFVDELLFIPNSFADILNVFMFTRVKLNMTMPYHEILPFKMHTDMAQDNPDFKTAIFYLNSNNGKTLFETGEEVESVENRLVIFDHKIKHTGTTHTDVKNRCVLNMNYIAKPPS